MSFCLFSLQSMYLVAVMSNRLKSIQMSKSNSDWTLTETITLQTGLWRCSLLANFHEQLFCVWLKAKNRNIIYVYF